MVYLFINPGITRQLLKDLHNTLFYNTFANKTTMSKEQILAILNNANEEFLERFFETMLNEINSDDEPYYKKARQLLLASLNNENADDFFIAICGWSLENLLERM